MIRRLYVHNFRCLENFELSIGEHSSVLLIGRNGSGKSTVRKVLELLQAIARGTNKVGQLVSSKDFSGGRSAVPIRFEVEAQIDDSIYTYKISFEQVADSKELAVAEEELNVEGEPIVGRFKTDGFLSGDDANFSLGKHRVALALLQERSTSDPLFVFRDWLARLVILSPIPSDISGDSEEDTLEPTVSVSNFGSWITGVLRKSPFAYIEIQKYLSEVMTDFKDLKTSFSRQDFRTLNIQFSAESGTLSLPFEALSDGEKCFMICAVVLAAQKAHGPLVCFWDEPDNYLSISEVGHFVMDLRRAFLNGGQFIATSHNPEVIRKFSDENTLLLFRNSHLEPTQVRPISELNIQGDLVGTLIRGDETP